MVVNHRIVILIMVLFLTGSGGFITNLHSETHEFRARRISFSGNDHFSNRYLRSLMEVRTKNLIERVLLWRRAPVFSEAELENDLDRIVREYQRAGFLNVRIVEEELLNDNNPERVEIRIILDEGKRVQINRVAFIFRQEAENSQEEMQERLRRELNLRENSYFVDSDFREDLTVIRDFFDRHGYPYRRLEHELILDESEEYVDIIYHIDKGPETYVSEFIFSGLNKVEERLLVRFIPIEPGDRYDPYRLEQTRNRLHRLGLFQFVSVNLRLEQRREAVPVEITLRERDSVNLNFGVGYGTEDRFRVFSEITRLRFLGGLRRATLFVKHSYLEPINLDFRLRQPGIPSHHFDVELNPFYRQEREPGYRIERLGGNLTIDYRLSAVTGTYLTYTFENNQLRESAEFISRKLEDGFDPSGDHSVPDNQGREYEKGLVRLEDSPSRNYRKSSITWGIMRDSSRPQFYPNRGSLISNTITLSGLGFGADFRFLRIIPEIRYYYQLSSDLVLAARLRGGVIKELTDDEYIPIEDRFYAGGSFSVRGWARSMLGPRSEDNKPVGGKSLIEGSIEFRHPIWGDLSGVAFFDYGNVWSESFDHDLYDLRYASGGGLRYATPVGPLRLDVGTPVGEGRERVQFFISLGQAF